MDSSEATTSQHGAQSGSKKSKVRTLNNAIRKTNKIRNKYKNVRAARIDLNLRNLVKIPVSSSKSVSSISSSITLAQLKNLRENKAAQVLEKSASSPSATPLNINEMENHAFSNDTNNLRGKLLESNKRCEDLMRKLEEQQDYCLNQFKLFTNDDANFPACGKPAIDLNRHNKQMDRLLRYMPSFNGKADDNYDSYVIGVRETIESYGLQCTEKEKLSAIRVKIGGDAREVLASSGIISSVEALLNTLHLTYGRDQRKTIADVKQKSDETVRIYANRLRMNLKMLGWVGIDDPDRPNIVSLEFFINGLLPSLSNEVRKLCPRTLDIAVDYAIQLESQKTDAIEACKNSKSKINHLTTDTSSTLSNDFLANFNRSIKDQLTALSNQLKDSFSQAIDTQSKNAQETNRHHPYNNSNNNCRSSGDSNTYHNKNNNTTQRNPSRPYRGTCFGCSEIGHTFTECKKITGEKKDEIRANYAKYLSEYRATKDNNALNSKGTTQAK